MLQVTTRDSENTQALFFHAVREEDYVAIATLLLQGADVNQKFGTNALPYNTEVWVDELPDDNALTFAVRNGRPQLTEFLLRNKANTEVVAGNETPLMRACFKGMTEITKLLLQYGANPNSIPSRRHGNYSLMTLVFLGQPFDYQSFMSVAAQVEEIVKNLMLIKYYAEKPKVIYHELRTTPWFIRNFFSRTWKSQNSTIDQAYIRSAAIGFFDKKLPQDCVEVIGSFLDRNTIIPLVKASPNAAKEACEAEDREIFTRLSLQPKF